MSEPLLRARGLVVRAGGRVLLDHIDIDVSAGEIVTVIGPNGGGKTTLVRTLLGLIRPDAGAVWRAPGLTIGYVPQRVAINPMMPVSVARLLAATLRPPRAAILAALRETGVEHLADQSVHTLSGGELRRVLLARALLRNPKLLVLDEPAAGVDHAGEIALYELIQRLRDERGCGVLMVSHDLHVVMAATDKVVCLNTHVCCMGRPAEVTRHSEYMRLFGPTAAGALAVYQHHHDHDHALSGDVAHAHPPDPAAPAPSSQDATPQFRDGAPPPAAEDGHA